MSLMYFRTYMQIKKQNIARSDFPASYVGEIRCLTERVGKAAYDPS